jgi:Toprim domain-containing protein/CHC2-type zinc finger protein
MCAMKKLSCKEACELDLVQLLKSLGHEPTIVRNHDYWFKSPFRVERTASFKVNQNRNIWYDFGEGIGGDLIDFGVRYFNCSVSKLLDYLSNNSFRDHLSFHPHILKERLPPAGANHPAGENKEVDTCKILILGERPLMADSLVQYLKSRCIPVEIAQTFCREIDFELYGKRQIAVGFKNNKGGFELRNEHFKASSSPKDVTLIDRASDKLIVVEGFFDFLSYQALQLNPTQLSNFLVLNSLSFFLRSKDLMDNYKKVNLYLDRDEKGMQCTRTALQWDSTKYIDLGTFLQPGQDLNAWLIHRENLIQKEHRVNMKTQNQKRGKGI